MGIKVKIEDGQGQGYKGKIGSTGLIHVCSCEGEPPEKGVQNRYRFFSQLVSSVGDGTGTTNMNVDGSVTPQKFYINATEVYDIRLMKLVIYIEDTTVSHATFGALAALGNGINISVIEEGVETFLVQAAKKFADLIQQTCAEKPWGDTTISFELQSVVGTDDAQVLIFDLGSLIPNGLRIGMGTYNKLVVKVSDNLTGLTYFTVRTLGYKHYA